MNMRRIGTGVMLAGVFGLAACDGSGGSSSKCPSLMLEFPEGETRLERSDMQSLFADAEKAIAGCPNVQIVSYIAEGDEETARMRKNHVSNFFSARFSDHFYKDETGKIDSEVVEAPTAADAGKVKVTFVEAAADSPE